MRPDRPIDGPAPARNASGAADLAQPEGDRGPLPVSSNANAAPSSSHAPSSLHAPGADNPTPQTQMPTNAAHLTQPIQLPSAAPHASASSAQTPPAAAMFAPATPIPFDRQFGQRLGGAIGAAMNAMTVKDGMLLLQISPDRLGKIEIAIDKGNDRMQITTDNEAVRGAIAQAHGRIEQELRAVGHRIGSIDVETRDSAANAQTGNNQAGAGQQRGDQNAAQQSPAPRSNSSARTTDRTGEHAAAQPSTGGRPSSNIFYA